MFGIKFPWQHFEKFFLGFIRNAQHCVRDCGIWNLGSWNPEYSSRNPESHKGLESEIQVPLTKNWNLVLRIRNPWRGIQNPRLNFLTWGDMSR